MLLMQILIHFNGEAHISMVSILFYPSPPHLMKTNQDTTLNDHSVCHNQHKHLHSITMHVINILTYYCKLRIDKILSKCISPIVNHYYMTNYTLLSDEIVSLSWKRAEDIEMVKGAIFVYVFTQVTIIVYGFAQLPVWGFNNKHQKNMTIKES